MSAYNAVPPVYGAPAGGDGEIDSVSPDVDAPPMDATQARLAAIKARLSDARKKNHKEVVEEDRRNKLGPEALKKEQAARAWEKKKEAGGVLSEVDKMMSMTAAEAAEKVHKGEKKQKRRAEYGWDVYNNEADYRHYKKTVRRAGDAGRVGVEGDEGRSVAVIDNGDYDPLDYGNAPPVAQQRVQALVDDMHEAAVRKAGWSRRRTFDEADDVTSINKRNEVFNKKIERAFDPYTAEIKANLERGTAL
eukprot:scaffold30993_cov242-Isochrysis_galbana.AAC.1